MVEHFFRFVFAFVAVTLPVLMFGHLTPSATYQNQAVALVGWGLLCCLLSTQRLVFQAGGRVPGLGALLLVLLLMALSAMASWWWWGLPATLALSALGLLGACALVLFLGAEVQRLGGGENAYRAFCWALLLAGTLSLAIALVQYFLPEWCDGHWMALAAPGGRVGGNLRQPNHLSSLLLWAMVALVWLHDTEFERCLKANFLARALTTVLMLGLLLGVALTVSRTGAVCVLMLTLWGVFDRSLSLFSRRLLWTLLVFYFLFWLGAFGLSALQGQEFVGAQQLSKADPSSSRFKLWANAYQLLIGHFWTGVGWGQFNLAWTLTPFAHRPTAFFDHTHNLVVQCLVELGVPLGSLVLALLLWGVVQGVLACQHALANDRPLVRSSFIMASMMWVHSMLEYPLWYAYFLLPTAFAIGLCLAGGVHPDAKAQRRRMPWPSGAALLLTLGAVASMLDYFRVVEVFAPSKDAPALTTRIASGQRSWLFAHHADYAQATSAEHPAEVLSAFDRPSYYLLDTRLMMAWARALYDRGEVAKAQFLAQRLMEFGRPESAAFFKPCVEPVPNTPLPFQCEFPEQTLRFEDFRATRP